MLTPEKKKFFSSALLLAAISLILLVCLFAYAGKSFGWLTHNREADSSYGSVNLENPEILAEYSTDGITWYKLDNGVSLPVNIFFSDGASDKGLLPGDTATVHIRFTNKTSLDLRATSFGLCTVNSSDETPVRIGETDYYFGSQIAASIGNSYDVSENSGRLYDTVTGKTDLVLSDAEFDFSAGTTVSYTFSLLFVDSETEDQNAYQGFGTDEIGGVCSRTVFMTYVLSQQ